MQMIISVNKVFENGKRRSTAWKNADRISLKINNLSLNDEQHLLVKNMYYIQSVILNVSVTTVKNLAELAKKRIENVNIDFSDLALKELRTIADATLKIGRGVCGGASGA